METVIGMTAIAVALLTYQSEVVEPAPFLIAITAE